MHGVSVLDRLEMRCSGIAFALSRLFDKLLHILDVCQLPVERALQQRTLVVRVGARCGRVGELLLSGGLLFDDPGIDEGVVAAILEDFQVLFGCAFVALGGLDRNSGALGLGRFDVEVGLCLCRRFPEGCWSTGTSIAALFPLEAVS
jgi:hypothetical protein